MSGGNFLLDANIVIPILNRDKALQQQIVGSSVFISVIVLGELYFGAHKSIQVRANLERVEIFKKRCIILDCDDDTAKEYGAIGELLRAKGRPIPENDIWIAAVARQHSLTLVSRDEHFGMVDGLAVEKW